MHLLCFLLNNMAKIVAHVDKCLTVCDCVGYDDIGEILHLLFISAFENIVFICQMLADQHCFYFFYALGLCIIFSEMHLTRLPHYLTIFCTNPVLFNFQTQHIECI